MNRKMKDSGVEWIGEIPEGWGVEPLKRLFSFGKGLPITKEQLLQEGLPVISYGQIHAKSNLGTRITEELIRFVATDYAERYPDSFAGINSFIVADTSEDIEGCGNSVYNDSIGTLFAGYHSIILKPTFSESARYYAYFFNSAAWRTQVRVQVSGVKVFSISQKILKNTVVLSPTKEEQQRIADFLDTQTAEIDASITKTRESIEEYKKLKQAVITQAVTKGIRPGRAMKDSGVEWIGDIPEEWGCIKVKYVTSKIGSGKTPSGGATTYLSEGVRFLRSQNIYNEGLVSEGLAYISAATDEEMKSTRVLFNDVLLNITGGSIGRCCTYPDDTPANVNQHVCIIRCVASKCIAKYMQYCWNSDIGQLSIKLLQNSANREGMSGENISNTFITYPALPEQQEIAAYLDEKCAAIDTLIEKKQSIITELEAYKKSLIYEYVTGKKEVPMAT